MATLKNELPVRLAKRYGKQVVYHALQDPSQSVILEVIATRIREIEKLQEELTTIKTNEKKARATLSTFEAKPRLSDLRQDIQQLEIERNAIQARLTSHQGDDEVSLPAEEREKLEREWKKWQRHATLRHRICRELWGKCTEVLPENMTSKELWESLGLEGTLQ
ncbi:hypothetical protein N7494_007425 [Penicillium frequentans]|uniref:Homologous-pairing protein 2 winged helix domain-containing protein n=1 Tax=Penicillium frequentans TaxID=3151616 RepID=A0AAD6CSF9_9EURO|nr:hypothetical protein N7494_007425 [Penicillium glabrum]